MNDIEPVKKIYEHMKKRKYRDLLPWEKYLLNERKQTRKKIKRIKENEILTDFQEGRF